MTDMHTIGENIAAHLDGFTVKPSVTESATCLVAADGREIVIWKGSYQERMEIRGGYPNSTENRYHTPYDWRVTDYDDKDKDGPRIGISATRDPKAIAKDIERRFLPRYTELFEACMVKKAEAVVRESKQADRMVEFQPLVPKGSRQDNDNGFRWHSTGRTYGGIKLYESDATLELHNVTHEQAKAILALL